LGLAGARPSTHGDLVLCAVPLVCAYVDMLCRHLSLRIRVIGAFFEGTPANEEAAKFTDYEAFVEEARKKKDPFVLESWALTWSTVVLSAAIIVYGIETINQTAQDSEAIGIAFILSGAIGLIATIRVWYEYRTRAKALETLAQQQKAAKTPANP